MVRHERRQALALGLLNKQSSTKKRDITYTPPLPGNTGLSWPRSSEPFSFAVLKCSIQTFRRSQRSCFGGPPVQLNFDTGLRQRPPSRATSRPPSRALSRAPSQVRGRSESGVQYGPSGRRLGGPKDGDLSEMCL